MHGKTTALASTRGSDRFQRSLMVLGFAVMGLKQVITDRWKRMSSTSERDAAPVATTDAAVFTVWRDLATHWRTVEPNAPMMTDIAKLEARVARAGGAIDSALAADLLASVRAMTLQPLVNLQERIEQLAGGSRTHQRLAVSHELKLTHLQDEIARCRGMIEQECRRRGLKLTSKPLDDDNLHDLLYQVFKAISHSSSRRMQAAATDPILSEIDRLIASPDPGAVDTFPAWLRQPAARVLALVQERNRYKRLLVNRGLLPPE